MVKGDKDKKERDWVKHKGRSQRSNSKMGDS